MVECCHPHKTSTYIILKDSVGLYKALRRKHRSYCSYSEHSDAPHPNGLRCPVIVNAEKTFWKNKRMQKIMNVVGDGRFLPL